MAKIKFDMMAKYLWKEEWDETYEVVVHKGKEVEVLEDEGDEWKIGWLDDRSGEIRAALVPKIGVEVGAMELLGMRLARLEGERKMAKAIEEAQRMKDEQLFAPVFGAVMELIEGGVTIFDSLERRRLNRPTLVSWELWFREVGTKRWVTVTWGVADDRLYVATKWPDMRDERVWFEGADEAIEKVVERVALLEPESPNGWGVVNVGGDDD